MRSSPTPSKCASYTSPRAEAAKSTGNFCFVAEDPDAAWERIAPHAMHEMNTYGQWAAESGAATGYQPIEDADELILATVDAHLLPDRIDKRK